MASGSRCWLSAVEPTTSRKQDGDLLQRLHEIGRVRFREGSQLRAQRSYARVDDSVTQDTALRLNGEDRGFELLLLRGH